MIPESNLRQTESPLAFERRWMYYSTHLQTLLVMRRHLRGQPSHSLSTLEDLMSVDIASRAPASASRLLSYSGPSDPNVL